MSFMLENDIGIAYSQRG